MKKFSLTFISFFFIISNGFSQDFEKSPIIFVHGMMGSGDTWSKTVRQFINQGYPENYLKVLDWNSLGGKKGEASQQLDSLIQATKLQTKHEKINLVGHSAGGGLGISYILSDTVQNNIGKYVHVGSSPINRGLQVPTLNLYSTADFIVKGKESSFVENQKFDHLDHYEIATDSLSFAAIYQFFNQESPKALKGKLAENISLSGRVVAMGENSVPKNARLEIYEFNNHAGKRISSSPIYNADVTDNGNWGPITVTPNSALEFVLTDSANKRIHYYSSKFTTSNNLLYLRTLPTSGMAAMLFAALPQLETQSTLVIFSANKATISGRDTLMVNDITLSTPELTEARKTIIAHFLYDDKKDNATTGQAISMYNMVPFLSGADIYLKPHQLSTITYNEQSIAIENKPSHEAISVVIFE